MLRDETQGRTEAVGVARKTVELNLKIREMVLKSAPFALLLELVNLIKHLTDNLLDLADHLWGDTSFGGFNSCVKIPYLSSSPSFLRCPKVLVIIHR